MLHRRGRPTAAEKRKKEKTVKLTVTPEDRASKASLPPAVAG